MRTFGKKTELEKPAVEPVTIPQIKTPEPVTLSSVVERLGAPAKKATDFIRDQVLIRIEPVAAIRMNKAELTGFVEKLVTEIANENKILLNQIEQDRLAGTIVDEMIGLGPIEPLLQDTTVGDILINGPDMIYVERRGKLELTNLRFRNNAHVLHVAQRIASSIGRSVDESSPMLDARLVDGSRVNVIVPPLALNGPCISVRKFSNMVFDFNHLVSVGSASPELARVLEICTRCRLNIIISGGTGSGKTTLLNALSSTIDPSERIVTIEDAAELKLQQEHVVRLETRPINIEGRGEINQRDLVRNALRMRPDRVIIGETRGPEAFDMMQAMNTGHDGSMSTVHSNTARDAIARIETMILMADLNLPIIAIRTQISRAIDLIVQIARMRDGVRRITEVVEVIGLENDVITLGSLFQYEYEGEDLHGVLKGQFKATPIRPTFLPRLEYFGLARDCLNALGINSDGDA